MKNLLIDTSYLMYRSYFAYPNLTISEKPVGAFFGFTKAIVGMIKDHNPDRLIFATDTPEPTWRHKLLPEYKANRPKMEDDMRGQIPIILDWCQLVTENYLRQPGFEADDLIFTVSKGFFEKENGDKPKSGLFIPDSQNAEEILVFSSDKDLYQMLVHNNVNFIRPKRPSGFDLFGKKEFVKKYELDPKQWVDFKALVGDPSDNLKGVAGIGPKTAVKVLTEAGSLKNLFNLLSLDSSKFGDPNIDGNNPEKFISDSKNQKIIEKIRSERDEIEKTYHLCGLQNVKEVELTDKKYDLSKGLDMLKEYKFSSIISSVENLGKKIEEPKQEALF